MIHVSIIIVNWNGKKDTRACLSSLRSLNIADAKVDITVVDNHSEDNSVGELSKSFPEVNVIVNEKNLGFTGGNNRGLEVALAKGADYIWLLNNDTTVDNESLTELVRVSGDDTVGIVGPKIYFSPGREFHKKRYKKTDVGKVFWYAGGIVDWKNMYVSHRGVDEVDSGQFNKTEETQFVSGCSMFFSRSVLEKIGFFDNKYYLYLEDFDFCMRAVNAGYKLMYAPKAVIWHKNAASSGSPGNTLHQYYLTRNRILAAMTYAPLRTKIAVMRESVALAIRDRGIRKRALIDAYTGKYGEQLVWEKTKE